jgi:hypothetical protein
MPTQQQTQLVCEALSYLRRDEERGIVLRVNDAPEWFADLCRTAHNGMMPDDWKYEFIQDALNALSDADEWDEVEPDVDSLYPYTTDRLNWLASRLERTGYCDEALADGWAVDSTANLIAVGLSIELREVFGIVRAFLQDRAEEEETVA